MNEKKTYRIRAERIEQTGVTYVSSLLKDNGILEQAIARVFRVKDKGLKQIDREIVRNEVKQPCAVENARIAAAFANHGAASFDE